MFSHRIRTRILAYFIASSVFICLLFSALSLLFSYNVEDSLFNKLLNNEMAHVQQQIENGNVPSPNLSFVTYYQSSDDLPLSIQNRLNEEPARIEFSGEDSRHYHLKKLASGFLVAEVSEYLIVRQIKSGMFKTQLVFLLLIGGVVALISWSLAKRIIKPIDSLVNVLSEVNDHTLPSGFSKEFTKDEIGMFAQKLDHSMQRISQFIQREQQFTRDVSHELRTPIAISDGALTLLKETSLTPEQSTLVTRLHDAQRQMQLCIDALLTLAREENFKNGNITLLPLIETCIIEHHKLIDGKDIELEICVSNEAKQLGNKHALKIILGNLLSNAFQHTHSGTIKITHHANTLEISDAGSGIDSDIFDNIYASGVKGEHSAGFGIGLSLVKRLCEKIGINITIATSNTGTTISLIWVAAP